MALVITEKAAAFLLARVRRDASGSPVSIRLRQTRTHGCGDIGSVLSEGGAVLAGDSVVSAHGVTIVVNYLECPDFRNAEVRLIESGAYPLISEDIVVVPAGGDVCGCGESARMPK